MFDPTWGDVAVTDAMNQQALRLYLKKSETLRGVATSGILIAHYVQYRQ